MKKNEQNLLSDRHYKRRVWMTVVGILTSGVSVGMFNFSAFGMDPFQVFAHGIFYHLPLGFGTFYTVLNLLMLLVVYKADRTKVGLGTLMNIFILGYMVQASSWFFNILIPVPTLLNRSLILIIGLTLLCLGSSLYFTANMGVSTYDAIALIMSEQGKFKFRYCRIGTDIICVLLGVFLGATAGVGTIITAFFMGPVIDFFNIKVASPIRDRV